MMANESTRTGQLHARGKQQGRARRWFGRAMMAGALALAALGGHAAEGQSLTPGGPVDFGSQPVGGTQTTLTLTFSATVPTTINSVNALTLGVANKDFTVVSQTCTGPQTPPQSCNVNIGFLPLAPGLRRGVLTLVDASGAVVNEIFLHGIGVGAQVSQSPAVATALSTLSGFSLPRYEPSALALDGGGNLYFNDVFYGRILKMTPQGVVTQFASVVTTRNSSMALDGAGTLYVSSGALVYKVLPSGVASVLSTGTTALVSPRGIAVDSTGYVYIADSAQNEIVRVGQDGNSSVLTITGLGTPLNGPNGLSIDSSNVLHIADTGNNRVVLVAIYTGAGTPGPTAQVNAPLGVAVDASASTVIADTGNARIVVSPSAGSFYVLSPAGVALRDPVAVAVKDNGDVVVADTVNGLVTIARSGAAQVTFNTSTPVGSPDTADNPQKYYLQNSGNVPLEFAVPASGTNPAIDNTAFTLDPATVCPSLTPGSPQDGSTQFVVGARCSSSADFTPSVVGTNTGHSVSTLTTLSGTATTLTPSALFTGTGISDMFTFTVTATPSVTQPGSLVSFTVSATKYSGAINTDYTGTVTIKASDYFATFPGGASTYTFTAADHGTHTFTAPAGVIFNSVGTFDLTATDGTYTGISNNVLVEYADAFTIAAAPSSLAVGQSAGYTVTATFKGALATNYVGTVNFSATDPAAVFLGGPSYTFTATDHGTHTFPAAQGAQFNTPGTFTIGATDSLATGTSNPITVTGPDAFTVTVNPATTAQGTVNTITVTATYKGATLTNYTGTILFTSTDSTAVFPAGVSYTFTSGDAGTHTFTPNAAGVQFNRAGTFTVTATAVAGSAMGTSNPVTVIGLTTFSVVAATNPTTTGTVDTLTVTAKNGNGVATGFVGTVRLSSTDATALFPGGATYTFTAGDQGTHTFVAPSAGVVFNQAGTFTVSATSGGVTGTSAPVVVNAASNLVLTATPNTTAVGSPVALTVAAYNHGVLATNYRGTVTFTSTDPAVAFLFGTSYTFTAADNGTHTFAAPTGVKFNTAGLQTVTGTDGSASGTSNTVTVTTTGATSFVLTPAATTVEPGAITSFTLTAMNGSSVATTFVGTVTFTSTDSTALFPAGATYTFTLADNGTHTFPSPAAGVQFNQTGLFTFSATSGGVTGTSPAIRVTAADSLVFALSPTTTTAGVPVGLTITAYDHGAVATNYRGTVAFTASTDPAVRYLSGTSYTFTAADNGTHTFTAANGVQFNTTGLQTISGSDGYASGTSNGVTVNPAITGNSVDQFVVTATPSATTIGTPVSYTVTAMLNGAVATGYTGTVTFSSTDATATFLSGTAYTFTVADNGSHTFTAPASGVSFDKAGTFTVSATNGTVTGTSNNVVVSAPAPATAFVLTASPTTTGVGTPVGFTISAVNSSGAVVTGYTGTATFSSSDPAAKLLGGTTYTFTAADAGTHTFAAANGAQFNTAGLQTISATDGSISGTSNTVTVVAATSFTIVATPTSTTVGTPESFTVTAMLNGAVATGYTGTITLSSTDGLAKFLGGTTYTFTAADAGVHTFSGTSAMEFESAGVFTIGATAGTLTGTSNHVTVTAPGGGFTITATPTSTTVGAPVSFTISATSGGGVNTAYRGTVTFTSTDSTAKFLAGTTYTFTAADAGTHTFTAPAAGVTFNQGGTFTVSATDGTLNGTSNTVTVLAATGFTVTATPAATTVGTPVSYTVTATNGTTTIPNFTGTVTFTSTDSSASFLAGTSYTFTAADNGTHTFTAPAAGVKFNQAGTFTVTATSGALSGTSNSVVVSAVGTGFTITATPTSTMVGTPVSFTITANTSGGVNTSYRGTVTFSATDPSAAFLAGTSYTFTAADAGTHTFTAPAAGVTFNTGGTFTVSATDGTISGTSNSVTVLAATGFAVVATPSTTTVGSAVSYTVTAVNGSTVIPNYTGTVTFTSTDATAKFVATSYTFTMADKGTHTFTSGVTFHATGTFTIGATAGALAGTSNSVVVNPVATGFTITATPTTTNVGTAVSFTISVVNGTTVVPGYTGTVTFTSTDATAKFLSGTSYTFTAADNGTKTFTAPASGVQFNAPGTFTIQATDGTLSGTSNSVTVVGPNAFTVVASPATTIVGTPVGYTVSATYNGAVVTNYTGTVTLSATDPLAKFLSGNTFTFTAAENGVHVVSPANGVQFNTLGTFAISAANGSVTGTSNNVVVTSTSSVVLTSSVNPVLFGSTTTLTAAVPAANGATPTGTVTFLDGTSTLGTGTLNASGVAMLANVPFTLLGTHSLTAVYSGDGNFASSTSAAVLEVVEDFSLGIASGGTSSLSALGGHTATYQLLLTPLGGPTFAAPVTFTATGLPTGAQISFAPASLSAGTAATTVSFAVTPPVKVAALNERGASGIRLATIAPWSLALLALGLGAFGSRRKRMTHLLLLALALLPLSAMTGCLSSANDGYYGAAPESYTITVTATSGTITHTQQVTLSVQ